MTPVRSTPTPSETHRLRAGGGALRPPCGACAVRAVTARLAARLAAVAALVVAPPGAALPGDRVELFAAQSSTHESNVFRTAGDAGAAAVDSYRTTSVGADFDVPVSAQRFTGRAQVSRRRYARFSRLDAEEHRGEAAWRWQAGRRLGGMLGFARTRTLTSFANLPGGAGGSRNANFLDTTRRSFESEIELTPRWRLGGEAGSIDHDNSAREFRTSNAHLRAGAVSLSYESSARNRIGVRAGYEDGSLPNRQMVGSVALDNSYRQRRLMLVLDWTMSAQSALRLRSGRVARDYEQLPQRNLEDWTFSLGHDWSPAPDFLLRTLVRRDLSAEETVRIGHVMVGEISLQPTMRLGATIDVSLNLAQSDRDYFGDPSLGAPGSSPAVSERVRTAGMGLSYRPTSALVLDLALRREARRSNLDAGDYDVDLASVELRARF